MKIDWIAKLQYLLQTMAFCLAIATIQYVFMPERPYAPLVVYSLCIGIVSWTIIDLGRHLFPSSAETGWPKGLSGLGLIVVGIVVGYLVGTLIADQLCRFYGWYAPGGAASSAGGELQLRTSILITALAGIVITYYFYNKSKSSYLERKMAEAHQQTNEARLKLLETQLEPHMLFNTLANLRMLIGTNPQRAQQMLDHMIAYLRATLTGSRSTTHTLQAEFDRLFDYLALMTIRMGPRLSYTLDLPPELARQAVPTLLLQPLVENSIKHGLEPKVEGGSIAVSARRQGSALVLEVADSGVGLSADLTSGKGFGLAQVRERLQTAYDGQAAIDFVASSAGGTRASITIPYQA